MLRKKELIFDIVTKRQYPLREGRTLKIQIEKIIYKKILKFKSKDPGIIFEKMLKMAFKKKLRVQVCIGSIKLCPYCMNNKFIIKMNQKHLIIWFNWHMTVTNRTIFSGEQNHWSTIKPWQSNCSRTSQDSLLTLPERKKKQ